MPPREKWKIAVRTPTVEIIDNHELVVASYTFSSTLLSDVESAALSDRNLATTGGIWNENFVLPADPDLLLERTGYACMDEEDFPPNSVDTENALSFFDHSCKGGDNGCHVTLPAPKDSCVAALKAKVGRVSASMRFERLAWNAATADSVRTGIANPAGADAEVLLAGVKNHRIIYRYIPADSCAIVEGCVGGPGWRRLLQFDASLANRGSLPIHLGDVSDTAPAVQHNMFEFSACHGHRHFSHYGKFTFGSGAGPLGSKRAFCLESTSRYSNNEKTPLVHPYSCHYQGIAAGWGDDYIAGIECQWIDVTTVDTRSAPVTGPLGFLANPDRFLCEGKPRVDASGNVLFEPTDFRTETGAVVDRISCDFVPNHDANNFQSAEVTLPVTGGMITSACQKQQNGPLRNCGFSTLNPAVSCTPGATTRMQCNLPANSSAQVVRVCESSEALGTGIPCTYRDALSNNTVESRGKTISFTCPSARDTIEAGGKVALYTTPLHRDDQVSPISCEIIR